MSVHEKVYSKTPNANRAAEIVKRFPQLGEQETLLWVEITKALNEAAGDADELRRNNLVLQAENRLLKAQLEARQGGQP